LPKDPKIRDLDIAIEVDEEVGWFDVAMDLVALVKEIKTSESLDCDVGKNLFIIAASSISEILEGATVHVLHHQSHTTFL
jgi:hypothetical protein